MLPDLAAHASQSTADPELLETAAALGRRLCRDAIWSGSRCNWLGDSMENLDGTWQVVHRAAGPELYAGTAGIGLFLARLWRWTGEALVRHTALGALRQAVSRRGDLDSGPARLGLYSGVPGLAWAALEIAEDLDDAEAREAAGELAEALEDLEPEPTGIDVIGGSAGAIPVLLDLAARLDRPSLRASAVRCGEHLLSTAKNAGDGAVSWDTLQGLSLRDLTGFGHGAAGIAWALTELAAATGDERFSAAARGAVCYEQACYSPTHRNWPDFRDHSSQAGGAVAAAATAASEPVYAFAWCHGAPGIGLGRLRSFQLTGDPALAEQGRAALGATLETLAYPSQGNFSLCHGHGGNAALGIFASQVLGEAAPLEAARTVGRAGIELFHRTRSPWPCGVPDGGETPGLMLGLAGIGYFYLRLYAPEEVPPVVILVPSGA